jgi:hypothetical protein
VAAQNQHWIFPIQVDPITGDILSALQDDDLEIESAMAGSVLWPLGARELDPNFGTPDEAFLNGGPDLDEIAAAISYGEPRAVPIMSSDPSMLPQFVANVTAGWTRTGSAPQ